MEFCSVLIAVFLVLLVILCRHLLKNRGQLEALGIPMVKPFLIFGSPPFALHKTFFHSLYLERAMKLGKTYGRYDGLHPVIATIDPDLIKSVTIKNFDSFTDIIDMEFPPKNTTLDISGGEVWRSLRKNLSPVFTSGKLRGMLEPMTDVMKDMMIYIDEACRKQGNSVKIKSIFEGLALDTISRCAFGIKTDPYRDNSNGLIKHGKDAFTQFRIKNWLESIISAVFFHFPGSEKYLPFLPDSYNKLFDITEEIIKGREDQNITDKNDFLARIMEMLKEKKENPDAEDFKHLSEECIISQGIIFFLAGYETTANTLATFCLNMAKNPDCQEKLRQEILEIVENHNGKVDHETIGEMEYLDAALNENLRLNGPVTMHLRTCTKDCEIAPGLTVKKGWRVDMPIYASHKYPEFFPEPDEFRPERFLAPQKHDITPYTFRAFGEGPRQCIGQRFSLIEMKLALANIFKKYQLSLTPESKLEFHKGDQFILSYPDFKLKFEDISEKT